MSKLACNLRDPKSKGKALRREGIIPAVVYGKNLDESISIQIESAILSKSFKGTHLGSQITLDVDGKSYLTMVKSVDYVPLSNNVQHIDFQVLTKGEKIKTSVSINFLNRENASRKGILQEQLSAIEYEVLPKDIIDFIELDLDTLEVGHDIKVSDLPMADDKKFSIITPLNATIVLLSAEKEEIVEVDEDAVDTATDVPVIGAVDPVEE